MLTYDQEEKNKMNWTLEIIEIFITHMKSDVIDLQLIVYKMTIADGNASVSFIFICQWRKITSENNLTLYSTTV